LGSAEVTQHIAIIGAGIGGLSAAIRLAHKGYRVSIYEQLERPGGKMGELCAEGFRFDTGPSVITMRPVFEQLWHEVGRDLNDYVQLVPLDPVTRYFWRDGLVLDATANEDMMCERISTFAPQDIDGYRKFMRYAQKLYDTISGPFLYRQQPSLLDLFKLPLADVFKIDALRTMHQAVQAHFTDPHLIQLFDRFATYNGSSPYLAPATLNVIAHVEMGMGAWYPQGGVFQLARAFEQLAKELGVELHYQTPVAEICTTERMVSGIRLKNGETISADSVIANADVAWTYDTLLPNLVQAKKKPLQLEPSCSGLVLMLGVQGQHNDLAHHNIFFSDDYPREFDDIFKRKIPPGNPTLYLCITSKTDPEHAPANHENWFVLANAPYLSKAFDWDSQREPYVSQIKQQLFERTATPSVDFERVMTPLDLQNAYGGNRGAIYGFSSNTKLAAFMRPNNRAHGIKNLYFATGSAHPGGGVPLVTLSGMAAAKCVMDDA
jgi:phytoene desaturase